MPPHDFAPLKELYPEIIACMPPVFTSHQFTLALAQRHLRNFPQLVQYVRGDANSVDIFGERQNCAEWRKF